MQYALSSLNLNAAQNCSTRVNLPEYLHNESIGQLVPMLQKSAQLHAACLQIPNSSQPATDVELSMAELDQLFQYRDLLHKSNNSLTQVVKIAARRSQ